MNQVQLNIEKIKKDFLALATWEDRYKKVIEIGRAMPALPESEKTEEAKVKGCQSQVWLHASPAGGGKIQFRGESDALIVNGLLGVVIQIFDGASPEDILATNTDFIKDIGFSENLSPNRANGLMSMIKQVRNFAQGFQILFQMQKSPKQ